MLQPPTSLVAQDVNRLDASSRIMYQAAVARDIACTIMPDYQTILMKHANHSWYTRGSRTSFQSAIGQTIVNNKALTKEFLTAYQIPTAKAVKVTRASELSQLDQLQWPLVMKPTQGAHGQGVVVGLNSLAEAKLAWEKATTPVLFEEMLEGTEYRIVCVGYTFVAAAFRKPAFVVGDGQHTIKQLIDLKNQQPGRAAGHQGNLSLIIIDPELERVLMTQQLELLSIPRTDQEVMLRKTANLSTGGEAHNVTDQVCAENKALFEQIARVCDLNVLGIDIMCQNLTTPITAQTKAGVIEVNKSPGLRMHHYPSQGESIDVAGQILTMTLQQLG
jgi:cyanophycin synthetase